MGKKTKKAKAKKGDFQKTKLKVGKVLKKHNETDTTMRVGKVALLEQLKTTSDQPTTFRKLTLQDLTQQCHHFNPSIRRDAVTGLKQLLSSDDNFQKRLSSVFAAALPLLIDNDKHVRSAAFSFFEAILRKIPPVSLKPHCPALVAQICCGLTHIEKTVKIGALNFCESIVAMIAPHLLQMNADILNALSTQLPGGKIAKTGTVFSRDEMQHWLRALAACVGEALKNNPETEELGADRATGLSDDLSFDLFSTQSGLNSAQDVAFLELLLERCGPFLRNIWLETVSVESVDVSERVFSDSEILSLKLILDCQLEIFAAIRRIGGDFVLRQVVGKFYDAGIKKKMSETFPLKTKNRNRTSDRVALGANFKFLAILLILKEGSYEICLEFFAQLRSKGNVWKICDFIDFCLAYSSLFPVDKCKELWSGIVDFICALSFEDKNVICRLVPCVEYLLKNGAVGNEKTGSFVKVILEAALLCDGATSWPDSGRCLRLVSLEQLAELQGQVAKRWSDFLLLLRKLSTAISDPVELRNAVQDFYYLINCQQLQKPKLQGIVEFFEDSQVKHDVKGLFVQVLCAKLSAEWSNLTDQQRIAFANVFLGIILGTERKLLMTTTSVSQGQSSGVKPLEKTDVASLEIEVCKVLVETVVKSLKFVDTDLFACVIQRAVAVVYNAAAQKTLCALLVFRIVLAGNIGQRFLPKNVMTQVKELALHLNDSVSQNIIWQDFLLDFSRYSV